MNTLPSNELKHENFLQFLCFISLTLPKEDYTPVKCGKNMELVNKWPADSLYQTGKTKL